MDNRSLSHTRWKCQYHIVFIPKYRKRILYKDAFENFMNDPDEVRYTSSEPVQSILQNISSNLEVEPIENPFDYIKKLQKDFPYKEIKFTDEFYNITGLTRQENI